MLLRAWANFSDWFFKEGFSVLGRSFPFPSLIGFFPSFCQALAEDRVTTPTKKKKKSFIQVQWLIQSADQLQNMEKKTSVFAIFSNQPLTQDLNNH